MIKLYRQNEVLLREGEFGKECFILMTGRVGVFKDGRKVTELYGKGTIFGELSELTGQARTSTIIALEESTVMVFEKGHEELIRKHPEIARKILHYLAERLVKTTDKLKDVREIMKSIT